MDTAPALASESTWWDMELESKPDFSEAMKRIYAWYEQAIIDRVPVRFTRHNAEFETSEDIWKPHWRDLKDKWFDEEYQVDKYLRELKGKRFYGETFPVFFPNLGPAVSAAFYGCPLEFGDVTSWSLPIIADYKQELKLDWNSPYMTKLEDLTRCVLEACEGKFIVGYSDLHGGMDVLAALRGTEPLLFDLVDQPDAPRRAPRPDLRRVHPGLRLLRRDAEGPETAVGHVDGHPVVRQNAHSELRLFVYDLDQAVHELPVGAERPGDAAHDAQRLPRGWEGRRQASG